MLKVFYIIFFLLTTSSYAGEWPNRTCTFPLQMLNLTEKEVFISFKTDIGLVYFDEPLEDHTLLPAGRYSYLYGVNFAPRDPQYRFKMIFEGEKQCEFTVGYFRFPEQPRVTLNGSGCDRAGYRIELNSNYETLVLFVA